MNEVCEGAEERDEDGEVKRNSVYFLILGYAFLLIGMLI
jgi:hypothetical protein